MLNQRVALDEHGGITVSTIFRGRSIDESPPILWETMIFGGKHDHYRVRYTSRQEAIEGHARAVKLAFPEAEREAK